jgi:hypothetical protein
VGVFENLHWSRYTKIYRQFFLSELRNLAECNPNVSFIIRTHPEGQWLRNNMAVSQLEFPNVAFASETGSIEEDLGAIFKLADCIITTPSTVALLAAQAGLPVAVVEGGLDLSRYDKLTLLSKRQDWIELMNRVGNSDEYVLLQEKSHDFVRQFIQPGNASHSIISDIIAHTSDIIAHT